MPLGHGYRLIRRIRRRKKRSKQKNDVLLEGEEVGIRKKNIDICHHFLQDMVDDKDIYIQYIRNEDNPVEIMIKNTSEADFSRHTKIIT